MVVLFEHTEKRLIEQMKFNATLHGAKVDWNDNGKRSTWGDGTFAPSKPKNAFMFGDPAAYEQMPMEERQKLTDRMMNQHKMWVQESKPMGGKLPIVRGE